MIEDRRYYRGGLFLPEQIAGLPNGSPLLFGFVESIDGLDPEAGSGNTKLVTYRSELQALKIGQPQTEITLACITMQAFFKAESAMERCPIGDTEAADKRRRDLKKYVKESDMSVLTLWVDEGPFGQSFIDNLLPSSWHAIVLGPKGYPVLRSTGFEMDDSEVRFMEFIGPVNPIDQAALTEIVSLNHLPEAEIKA